ncbi:MAG: PAS domain-containing protein [Steroidobacteraceae bacterium]
MNSKLKVLIVEDSPIDAELAVASLEHNWQSIDWRRVESEAQFINELAWQPDIIIADYEVPRFGAPRALQLLTERSSDIPLIVFTGAVTEEIVVRCMRLGAADYLLKDRLTRLGPAIENALNMRREHAAKLSTEREQQKLAALNSALLDSLPAQAALLDKQGNIIATNAAWRNDGIRDGFSNPAWRIGSNYAAACEQRADRDNLHALGVARGVRAVLSGEDDHFTLEYPAHNKQGQRWLRMMVTPVTTEYRDGGAVVMHIDVTERRAVEEQLKINTSALQHLTEGVVITDAKLQVVTVNKAYSAMTGYEQHEVAGLPLWTAVTGEESSRIPRDLSPHVLMNGSWSTELQSRRKNGQPFRAIFSLSPVPGEHGRTDHYTAVLTAR